MGNLLEGLEELDRIRSGEKPMTAAALAPVIQNMLEQVDAANLARQQAEQRLDTERAARMKAEDERSAAVRAKDESEGGAIRERAAREAAEVQAREAVTRAAHFESMHRQECENHKKTMDENISLRQQLAAAREEAKAAKEEVSRFRRDKPQPALKPAAYVVEWIDREGKPRTMNVTPRS